MSLLTQRRISLARQLAANRALRRRSLAGGGGLGLAGGAAPSVSQLKLARSGLLAQQNPVGGSGLVAGQRGFGGNRRLLCLLILLFLFFRPFGGFGFFPFF